MKVHDRIRNRMTGTEQRPRLNVYRSLNHIYAQLIDDMQGTTVASASSMEGHKAAGKRTGGNVAAVTGIFNVTTKVSSASGINYSGFNVGTVSGSGAAATVTGSTTSGPTSSSRAFRLR